MKTLLAPIATLTLALWLGGCGSDNDDGGGASSANASESGRFIAAVRDTLGQPADAEPAAVDDIAADVDDSAEPETL